MARDDAQAKQFSVASRKLMQLGLAPATPKAVPAGGRRKFELDHHVPLRRGGPVHDSDNMQVLSPKAHVEKSRNE
ncbi:HNH endonuclease signature motif containing protein [Paracoccus sp. p1-h21]|uniref:HNH endonuclease signature motif containing protein n=1 Tax=Paracoccus sp. p1-h21 TaxID=3366951 RepID=UPI0037B451DD